LRKERNYHKHGDNEEAIGEDYDGDDKVSNRRSGNVR
jgi:hypothetical protein